MSRIGKAVGAVAASVGVAGAIALAAPGVASAAAYGGQCGSSYGVVDAEPISGGTVYLTRYGNTVCAVTIRTYPGARQSMSVWLRRSGTTTWTNDPGDYTTYAGPVYVYAPGCADFGGRILTSQTTIYSADCF